MKFPAIEDITYTSFSDSAKALDWFFAVANEATQRHDRRALLALRQRAHEWHLSINNRRLNYDDPEITPIIRLNLGRVFYELGTLMKVIDLKLASIKR